ncbi:MAG: tyrosine-type recombinase/integrase [Chloroflexi bacterium]|nr:tyrosine-type recombinase/integrase [Chloroflexota bacterium]
MEIFAVIQNFLNNREKRECNPNAIKTYSRQLSLLARWLEKHHSTNIEIVTSKILNEYVSHLRDCEKKLSPTTIRQRAKTIRTFARWIHETGIVTDNPNIGFIIPKKPHKLPKCLPPDQIHKLISAETATRDRAIIFLILDSGMRRGEVAQLEIDDLDLVRGMAHVKHGKGDKERWVIFAKKTTKELEKWINERRAQPGVTALFTSRHGKPMNAPAIYKIIKRVAKTAGVNVSTHALRHTFATNYLDRGGNIHDLQTLLGHEDITTTMIYVSTSLERIRQTYKQLSFLDNMPGE